MTLEGKFKAKMRRLIKERKAGVHQQSVTSAGCAGTPDQWYSGRRSDLWVEYKFDERKGIITPKLSPNQRLWLDSRRAEGRNVAVIVGLEKDKALVFTDGAWNTGHRQEIPTKEAVDFIINSVN